MKRDGLLDEEDGFGSGEAPGGSSPALGPVVREHLGRKLRATYNEIAENPQNLPDPAIPVEMEYQISRLERREVIHNQGVKAVEAALGDILNPRDDER